MSFLLFFLQGCIHIAPVNPPLLKTQARRFELDNGLRVVLDPVPGHGEIVSRLHYRVGEADLKTDESGLAHLTEHLMFEGSANVANGEYDRLLNASGGESSAFTTHDAMVFTARFPTNALERFLYLESDRMGWLCEGLLAADISNQKEVVNQETLRDLSSSTVRIGLLLRSMIFDGTPLSRDPGGDYLQIEQHDLRSVCQFSKRWLRPDNAILTLSGSMDPTVVEAAIRHWFSDVSIENKPKLNHANWLNVHLATEKSIEIRGPFTELIVGWPTVPKGHPDASALNLIMDLIAHPADGILSNEQVKVDGLVNYTRMGGMFTLRLSGWSHQRLIKALDKALSDLNDLPPKRLELSRYRRRAAYIRAWGDLNVRARLLSYCIESNQEVDCIQKQIEKEFRLTNTDIQKVARLWLADDRRFVIRAGPSTEKATKP